MRVFEGIVTDDNQDKTRLVEDKGTGAKIAVHDEFNETVAGDRVSFVETAQISPTKRHTLVKVKAAPAVEQ